VRYPPFWAAPPISSESALPMRMGVICIGPRARSVRPAVLPRVWPGNGGRGRLVPAECFRGVRV